MICLAAVDTDRSSRKERRCLLSRHLPLSPCAIVPLCDLTSSPLSGASFLAILTDHMQTIARQ